MRTRTIPPYHGVRDNLHHRLDDSQVTLAEILKGNGFATAAVIGTVVLDARFGLHQGFDSYHDRFDAAFESGGIAQRRGEEVSRYALQWLDKRQGERFFLFVHYYDPHDDYVPPEPFAASFPDSSYAGEIAYTDHCVGQIIARLKALDLYDSTLIIITSDHGEMLGEHNEATHSYFIYESALRVPLIFKLPGVRESRRVDELVGLIDVVPTICDLASIEPPTAAQGRSLRSCFAEPRTSTAHRDFYCESLYATRYGACPLLGVVQAGWKYIHATRPELYDLAKDPAELVNLVEEQPRQARLLKVERAP